ncbi:hypothetical protein Fcan01_16845 [Folsomia candida]|uniref:Uncharacterized protein n=1 Tax=Folsomia candida TaxID=158441 RepID=A0A226DRW7_FOLCA|nr:hypothetical protein Fcan01_16845 [Folsomia candida]
MPEELTHDVPLAKISYKVPTTKLTTNTFGNPLYPNRKSILGLRFCFGSTILIGVGGPFLVLLLTLYDPKMHPFLGSVVVRQSSWNLSFCKYILHPVVFFTQHWTNFVLGSLILFIFGNIFMGTVLCVVIYLQCLSCTTTGSESLEKMRVKVHLYKQLQILLAQINQCYRPLLLPTILCFVVSGSVFGSSLTFTLKSSLFAHPANFFYPFLAAESTLALLGMGTIAGCVNKRSIRYISKIRRAASKRYPNRKSILGLRVCFVSTILIATIGPFLVVLLTLYDPTMHPFLGSLVARHCKMGWSVCNYFLHTVVFFTQHWTFFVLGSLMLFIYGNLFFGMVLCVATYLHCLSCTAPNSQSPAKMRVKIYLYKQLQILVAQFNLCYRRVLLPIILCFIVSANVFGASITFTLRNELFAHPANFIYPFLAMESTIFKQLHGNVDTFDDGKFLCQNSNSTTLNELDSNPKINWFHPVRDFYLSEWIETSPSLPIGTKAVTLFSTFDLPFCYFAVVLTLHKNPGDFVTLLRMGLEHEEVTIARECARKMNNSGRLLRWVLLIFGCGSSTLAPIGFMLMLLSDPNLPSFIGSVIPDWQDDGNGQIEASILRLAQINLCFRSVFLPTSFAMFALTNVISTFITLSRGSYKVNGLGGMVFLVLSVESFFGIFTIALLAGLVNEESKKLWGKLKRVELAGRVEDKQFHKRLAACGEVRIKFGDNFVTILTPLVMLGVCIKWTVKLLLTVK